ncbi:MAG: hypothetical protein ABH950_10145 [Candidatus Altiarchaeota archaeon]
MANDVKDHQNIIIETNKLSRIINRLFYAIGFLLLFNLSYSLFISFFNGLQFWSVVNNGGVLILLVGIYLYIQTLVPTAFHLTETSFCIEKKSRKKCIDIEKITDARIRNTNKGKTIIIYSDKGEFCKIPSNWVEEADKFGLIEKKLLQYAKSN